MSNVIFIHPDGASPSHYGAARFVSYGPDGRLWWDRLDEAGVYLGHMDDRLTGTSNAGAVTHAMGVKAPAPSFGLDENGQPLVSLSGQVGTTIMEEAIAAGKAGALINSGFIAEPGTGAFIAEVESRRDTQDITRQVIESGLTVIMGGGERDYLPEGVQGVHGVGQREDGLNLIARAEELGYSIVYNRQQLLDLPADTERVLGIFAEGQTFNDEPEEVLGLATDNPQPLYVSNAPTVGEMLSVALPILNRDPEGFFVVLEEEGSDNFGNNGNAIGTITATQRADDAIGVAYNFINSQGENPNTLLVTAADSDGGGLEIIDLPSFTDPTPITPGGVPLDGVRGSNTEPFVSVADRNGDRFPFAVSWVENAAVSGGSPDVAGSIVSKAHGLNAELLPATLDNTDIYRLMYRTLFGVQLPDTDEIAPQNFTGTEGNDAFVGLQGDDVLTGLGGDDVLLSRRGADNLDGGDGNDVLFAGRGNDTVVGGAGDDTLSGDMDTDTLIGGAGSDTFVVHGDDTGIDTIADFEVGVDRIGLEAVTFAELSLIEGGGRTTIALANQESEPIAFLNGVSGLTEASFV